MTDPTMADPQGDSSPPFCYEYPRPAVSVDLVVLRLHGDVPEILLIERKRPPFAGAWALPGGFLEMNEDLETSARRELQEETHLQVDSMRQCGAFSSVHRDPRGRVISVGFVAVVDFHQSQVQAGDDASAAAWFPLNRLPTLAFDHAEIVSAGVATARKFGEWE